ncbi:hypothetical protein Tco_0241292 [Tanacetum coccineum]
MGVSSSYIQAVKTRVHSQSDVKVSKPALVLDDSCFYESDLTLSLASNSFNIDERFAWIEIEGVPLCAWTNNTFSRISSIWGSLLYDEDEDATHLHRKRLCWAPNFTDDDASDDDA